MSDARHDFRVTVEDLTNGTKQVMEIAAGDYVLIPFEPCYLDGAQLYPTKGTHVLTVKGYAPVAKGRQGTVEPTPGLNSGGED